MGGGANGARADVTIAAAVVALVLTFGLGPIFRRLALAFGHVDVPNIRSSHRTPTPRSGGLAILIGIVGAAVASDVAVERPVAAALGGAAVLAAMALVDERRALPRRARLIVQVVVAVAVMTLGDLVIRRLDLPGASLDLGPLAGPFTVIWIVGLVNVYNFMDGANGLASGQAIVAGAALAALAATDPAASLLAAVVAGSALGFLPWNFPRAAMFMGDTGSNTLGIAFAALSVRAAGGSIPLPAAALPLAPFLLDASMTVLIRIRRGEAFFSTPHRLHFYQRLLDRGWGHARVTVAWTSLATVSSLAALAYVSAPAAAGWAILAMVLALHAAVALAVVRARPMIGSSP